MPPSLQVELLRATEVLFLRKSSKVALTSQGLSQITAADHETSQVASRVHSPQISRPSKSAWRGASVEGTEKKQPLTLNSQHLACVKPLCVESTIVSQAHSRQGGMQEGGMEGRREGGREVGREEGEKRERTFP